MCVCVFCSICLHMHTHTLYSIWHTSFVVHLSPILQGSFRDFYASVNRGREIQHTFFNSEVRVKPSESIPVILNGALHRNLHVVRNYCELVLIFVSTSVTFIFKTSVTNTFSVSWLPSRSQKVLESMRSSVSRTRDNTLCLESSPMMRAVSAALTQKPSSVPHSRRAHSL